MKKFTLTCIALIGALLTFSSLATAKPDKPAKPDKALSAKSIAKEQCQALKKADKAAFKAVYGSNSIGKCVKAQTQTSDGELKNAAKACKAERASDPQAFEDKYGSAKSKGNNAFGKCVSSKVGEDDDEADDDEADDDEDEADDDEVDDDDEGEDEDSTEDE